MMLIGKGLKFPVVLFGWDWFIWYSTHIYILPRITHLSIYKQLLPMWSLFVPLKWFACTYSSLLLIICQKCLTNILLLHCFVSFTTSNANHNILYYTLPHPSFLSLPNASPTHTHIPHREMVEAEPGLNSRLDKPFLLSFLRARKFDYDKAMAMVSWRDCVCV